MTQKLQKASTYEMALIIPSNDLPLFMCSITILCINIKNEL